jgi:protein-L-isoaspartate(D-aspartate) O-methyltransferase
LRVLGTLARERFVPPEWVDSAYIDDPLPLGHGATISQPYIVALMTSLAHVEPGDRVLEVGTGSGYQAAVLAELGAVVFSVELEPELAATAAARLGELGYARVTVRAGDGRAGLPEGAPYDAILVTAAPAKVPEALLGQLTLGGRLVIPVGTEEQDLWVYTRTTTGFDRERIAPVRFVPLRARPY